LLKRAKAGSVKKILLKKWNFLNLGGKLEMIAKKSEQIYKRPVFGYHVVQNRHFLFWLVVYITKSVSAEYCEHVDALKGNLSTGVKISFI